MESTRWLSLPLPSGVVHELSAEYVAQAGLELQIPLHSLSCAGIYKRNHHAWLLFPFSLFPFFPIPPPLIPSLFPFF